MAVKVRERPKGSGIYWIFIDHQGKRKSKKIGRDKRLAQEAAKKIEAKLVLGDFGLENDEESRIPTFGDYAQSWITVTVPATCKPSTLSDYGGILTNHVLPVFGKKSIKDINRLMVKKFLMQKAEKGLAPSTVSNMKSAISGVFNLAIDDDVIAANPAHRLGKIFRVKNLQEEIDPLTREELASLLQAFRDYYPGHYPLALTIARTGLRLGEAIALKWGDIDFKGRFIIVQRSYSRGKTETPKSGKSRRVDMSKQLTETLIGLRRQRKLDTLKQGWRQMPDWIFINNRGEPLDINNWRKRVFYRALEKAGLRRIRIHDLRHTYASLLIQAGESLPYVRDQLGHHSISVTVDIYGHLAPEGNKEAVDKLDDQSYDTTIHATIRNLSATNK
jgi:integrase